MKRTLQFLVIASLVCNLNCGTQQQPVSHPAGNSGGSYGGNAGGGGGGGGDDIVIESQRIAEACWFMYTTDITTLIDYAAADRNNGWTYNQELAIAQQSCSSWDNSLEWDCMSCTTAIVSAVYLKAVDAEALSKRVESVMDSED